jgi:hypothetical protein
MCFMLIRFLVPLPVISQVGQPSDLGPGAQCANAKPPQGMSLRGHGAAVKVQDSVLRDFSSDSALEPGGVEEDYVPVTPRHYLGRAAVSKTGPCRVALTKKTPPLSCFDCASEPR